MGSVFGQIRDTVRNLDREIRLQRLRLAALVEEITNTEDSAYLLDRLPRWAMMNFDGDELRGSVAALAGDVADFLVPITTLYAPLDASGGADSGVSASLQTRKFQMTLDRLINIGLDTRVNELARDLVSTTEDALTFFTNLTELRYADDGQLRIPVVIRIPNPSPAPGVARVFSSNRAIDAAHAAGFWQALTRREKATLRLGFNDIYAMAPGESGKLLCNHEVPLVNRVALVVVHSDDRSGMNGFVRAIPARLGAGQSFSTVNGPLEMTLADGRLRELSAYVLNSEEAKAADEARVRVAQYGAIEHGLSPVTSLTFDFRGYREEDYEAAGYRDASHLLLVLFVEAVQAPLDRMGYIGSCEMAAAP